MPTGAIDYHERTKHSPRSVHEGGRGLNFDNKPRLYKVYTDLPAKPLSDRIRPPRNPALAAIAEPTPDGDPTRAHQPDLETVTSLCYYAAGVTKRIDRRGRTLRFRAAAATGALYHVDLYVVCGELGGDDGDDETGEPGRELEAGVYHFDPRTLSLDVLREGLPRRARERQRARGVADAPLSVVATSTWWRNAWKYGDRTFRHAFWDSGTHLARTCWRSPTRSTTAPRSSPASRIVRRGPARTRARTRSATRDRTDRFGKHRFRVRFRRRFRRQFRFGRHRPDRSRHRTALAERAGSSR